MAVISIDHARRVFHLFAVQAGCDDEPYVPAHFAPYALREMALYPTVTAVDRVLTGSPLSQQGRVTFGLFVQLCEEAANLLRHMSSKEVHVYVSQLDLHEDGVISRAEFALLVGGGVSTMSFSEMDAILDLLDPTRSDNIRLTELEEVLRRGAFQSTALLHSHPTTQTIDATRAVRPGHIYTSRYRESVPCPDDVAEPHEASGRLRQRDKFCLGAASAPLPQRMRRAGCAPSRRMRVDVPPTANGAQNSGSDTVKDSGVEGDADYTAHPTPTPRAPEAVEATLAVHSDATVSPIPAVRLASAVSPHVAMTHDHLDSNHMSDDGDDSPDVRVSERAPTAPPQVARLISDTERTAPRSPQRSPPPQPFPSEIVIGESKNVMEDDQTCAQHRSLPDLPPPRARQWAVQKQSEHHKCCVVC